VTRRAITGAAAVLAAVAVAVAAVALLHGGRAGSAAPPPAPDDTALATLNDLCESQTGDGMQLSCFTRKLTALLEERGDSAGELPRIDAFARRTGGYLATNCHIVMHAVGRAYAADEKLTLARLQDALPRSNDPGCSAGFAHGMLIALAPTILAAGPRASLAACERAGTRYERYSCVHGLGHAYMRLAAESLAPALDSCRRLGATAAPDCAQGVFHDYYIALSGADGTRTPDRSTLDPRRLCAGVPGQFVRPCWYRAYLEVPAPFPLRPGTSLLRLCRGLAGDQRSGCITAGTVAASLDPFHQLAGCARLAGADAVSCVHGVSTQILAGKPLATQERLLRGCAALEPAGRAPCAGWLGKVLTVVTDGRFAGDGCDAVGVALRPACRRGAASQDGALVTFS
jgi:hypothetical protein